MTVICNHLYPLSQSEEDQERWVALLEALLHPEIPTADPNAQLSCHSVPLWSVLSRSPFVLLSFLTVCPLCVQVSSAWLNQEEVSGSFVVVVVFSGEVSKFLSSINCFKKAK